MKQTAVEWLIEQISSSKYFYNLMEEIESKSTIVQPNAILQQAKAMEKEQIISVYWDAYNEGKYSTDKTAEEYYKETFIT
jgi:HEPN domain-containing protein